jgi:hypothetical protein
MAESRLALAALLIVPLGAAVVFALLPERGSKVRPVVLPEPQDDPSLGSEDASEYDSPEQRRQLRRSREVGPSGEDDTSPERREANQDEGEPDEWDGRVQRFDDNTERFDERLSRFEEEAAAGRMNLLLGTRVTTAVREAVLQYAPEARVKAVCSVSVCEIEMSSEEPVGQLVADLGPWLLEWPDGATGDPRVDDSATSFRILFDANVAPQIEP